MELVLKFQIGDQYSCDQNKSVLNSFKVAPFSFIVVCVLAVMKAFEICIHVQADTSSGEQQQCFIYPHDTKERKRSLKRVCEDKIV